MQVTRTALSGCSTGGSWKKAWGWRNAWTKYRFFRCIGHRARDARVCRSALVACNRSSGFDSHLRRDPHPALPDFRAGVVESLGDPALEFRLLAAEPRASASGLKIQL